MGLLRRIGNIAGGVLKKVGQVGGQVLGAVGHVKAFADKTGLTGALQTALMSNPETAPLGAGLALANKGIAIGQKVANKLVQGGQALQNATG